MYYRASLPYYRTDELLMIDTVAQLYNVLPCFHVSTVASTLIV